VQTRADVVSCADPFCRPPGGTLTRNDFAQGFPAATVECIQGRDSVGITTLNAIEY